MEQGSYIDDKIKVMPCIDFHKQEAREALWSIHVSENMGQIALAVNFFQTTQTPLGDEASEVISYMDEHCKNMDRVCPYLYLTPRYYDPTYDP